MDTQVQALFSPPSWTYECRPLRSKKKVDVHIQTYILIKFIARKYVFLTNIFIKTTNVIILTLRNYMLKLNIYFVKDNSSYLYVCITIVYSIFNLSTPTMLVPHGKQAGMYKWVHYTNFKDRFKNIDRFLIILLKNKILIFWCMIKTNRVCVFF